MMPTTRTTGPDANPSSPIVASLLPDDARWDETGLLSAANAFLPLPIEIPAWTDDWVTGSFSSIRVYWDNTLIYEKNGPMNTSRQMTCCLTCPGITSLLAFMSSGMS